MLVVSTMLTRLGSSRRLRDRRIATLATFPAPLRRRYLAPIWVVFFVALQPACRSRDSDFAALQRRGAAAMGVDQYTSSHVFEALPDGGRIVLQRQTDDSAGTATIRAHMSTIAEQFRRGDFAVPGFVHAQGVPGTDVMTSHRTRISYRADTLPRGGQVQITTTDPAALTAIHEFLAFQRREHHAAGHGK
jgi:hypothetical protein